MQKSILLFVLLFSLVVTSFAQVEEAIRYRVLGEATLVEQHISVSNSIENADNMILQNRSNSQLEELGSRYAWVRSGSQLEELGSRYAWVRSGSQLEELGSRYAWVRSGSQLEELGSRYAFVR